MTDMFTPKERSRIMARIRSRGNGATELRFVRLLRRFQIKGWRRGSKLPGRPDVVFHRHRVAVFIDGDFWHGNPRCFRVPKSNVEYWTSKISGNRRRDRAVNRALAAVGWCVVRFWQSSLQDDAKVMAKLAGILAEQGARRMRSRTPLSKNSTRSIAISAASRRAQSARLRTARVEGSGCPSAKKLRRRTKGPPNPPIKPTGEDGCGHWARR